MQSVFGILEINNPSRIAMITTYNWYTVNIKTQHSNDITVDLQRVCYSIIQLWDIMGLIG